MKKEIKFYVIGGQYQALNHGGAATLLGAKRLAKKYEEYWDNWQGFHVPSIYAAEDCVESSNFYGDQILPRPEVNPVAFWNGKKWEKPEV